MRPASESTPEFSEFFNSYLNEDGGILDINLSSPFEGLSASNPERVQHLPACDPCSRVFR
jgi:hypothetical protein